jgi:SAM-dependent methyltransferase
MRNDVTKFYANLGVKGLSNLLTESSNNYYYKYVVASLVPGNILDVGCGYGRISIPLLKNGYDVKGVDIMLQFIDYANTETASERFIQGDMLALSYDDSSFDNAICLWSTFNHFLSQENQEIVLNEMLRILKPGGKCIIDLPTPEIYNLPKLEEVKTSNPTKNICNYTVNGIPNKDYVHNEASLELLIGNLDVTVYSIERVLIGELPRLILTFTK